MSYFNTLFSHLYYTVRERRQRLREQGVLNGSPDDSVEDLSIDASVGSHSELDRASGIGRVSFLFCFVYFNIVLLSRLLWCALGVFINILFVVPFSGAYGRVNN